MTVDTHSSCSIFHIGVPNTHVLFYLHRDSSNPSLYRVSTFDKSSKAKPAPLAKVDTTPQGKATKPVENLIHEAVSGFVGITRAVRQHLLPDKNLLDVSVCVCECV